MTPRRIKSTPPLSREEELVLIRRAQQGDDAAATRLITSLVPMLYREALRWGGPWLETEELVTVGMASVQHAIKKFDLTRGLRLSSYAAYWWRQDIAAEARYILLRGWGGTRGLAAGRAQEFRRAWARTPRDTDDDAAALAEVAGVDRSVAAGYLALQSPMGALDKRVDPYGDSDHTLGSLIADTRTPTDDVAAASIQDARVRDAVEALPERYRLIIKWRYFERAGPTFREVGARLGVTKQRAEQLEAKARVKLRQIMRRRGLAPDS